MISPTCPELVGDFGMVASTHWLGSATGMSVLEAGGNAFDAAVAAGFVLQVVEPHLSGPAGEVPIIVGSGRDQSVDVICGQGVAPRAATYENYKDLGLDIVPGTGLLSATVPGAFGAWMLLLERWGTWHLRDVLKYAIGYARNGFPAVPMLVMTIDGIVEMLREDWPTSAELWLNKGVAPKVGSRIRLSALADTYERLLKEAERVGHDRDSQIRAAVDVWYRGFVAETIVDFCHDRPWMDTSGRPHRGMLDGDDFGDWEATTEAPATYNFGRYTVCKTGPWGQGPVLLQQLALLDALDIRSVAYASAEYFHLMIEGAKLAFADREAWYGDSGTVTGLVEQLLDPAYNKARSTLVSQTASFELRPGSVNGKTPVIGSAPASVLTLRGGAGVSEPTLGPRGQVRGDTCHIDVADRHGNIVSATPSGGWLQSSPTIPSLGFCLGTRAQMFWLEPGHPNSLRPGARPRTTLTPSVALRDGKPWMAFGTPGGDQQDQWSLAFFCSVVLGGLDLQGAIDAPAFTSEHFPSSFYPRISFPGHLIVEERMDSGVIDDLRRRGHDIEMTGPWVLGRLSAVARDEDGFLRAGANARGSQGYAAGR
jgi:gamma-glutamyltranspeptidase/glutathione hydrolase